MLKMASCTIIVNLHYYYIFSCRVKRKPLKKAVSFVFIIPSPTTDMLFLPKLPRQSIARIPHMQIPPAYVHTRTHKLHGEQPYLYIYPCHFPLLLVTSISTIKLVFLRTFTYTCLYFIFLLPFLSLFPLSSSDYSFDFRQAWLVLRKEKKRRERKM